jgi:hypothetical protein
MHAMTRTFRQLLLPAALLAAAMTLAVAAPASADWRAVIKQCVLEKPLDGYSRKELVAAKQRVAAGEFAYTECRQRIGAAISALNERDDDSDGGAGGAGSDADLNGDGVVTPAEKRAAKERKDEQAREVASINDTLRPDGDGTGTIAGDTSSDGSGLPLILAIVVALLLAAAGGTWFAAQRNPGIANALRRVPLPGRRG